MNGTGRVGGDAWAGRSVLITGGSGLLGSWLVAALLDSGARLVVLRRFPQAVTALELAGLREGVDVVGGDCRDLALVQDALTVHRVDTVFHLAAQSLVGTASRAPMPTFDANVRGTWTVLEACRLHDVARVVVASSDKAYGPHEQLPYREDHELRARFPYDVSKAAADLIARSYWHSFGLPVAVTRFANLYGGGDLNFSRVVPSAAAAALAGQRPQIRSDGSPVREYLYVADAVAAYLAIAEMLGRGEGAGEAFNAGGGEALSVREMVALVCAAAGADVEPEILGAAPPAREVVRECVDSGRLRRMTGWTPEVGLRDGLARTVDWYRAHQEVLPRWDDAELIRTPGP